MGNSISAPPPIKIIIHHSILDEPIITAISDPNVTYSSLAQRIIETDFYTHCKLLPLLQSVYPTKLSTYQLLFGGNRAIVVKPCWSTDVDDACIDVNVALRIREANTIDEATPPPNCSILNTLPKKYSPNQEGRRPDLELEMVCTKIRKFGCRGSYVRVDDTLTKLIKCEIHPGGRGYIHAKIMEWDEGDEDCAIPEKWVCQFDSDDEDALGDVSTIASRVEAVQVARAMTPEATKHEASEARTKKTAITRKNGVARKKKKVSKAGVSHAKNDVPRENITEADKATPGDQVKSISSREEIIEAARVIAEEETSTKPTDLKKRTDSKAIGSHCKKDTSSEGIFVETEATDKAEISNEYNNAQHTKKSTKNKNAESKDSGSQTKNIASRNPIIEAANAAEKETRNRPTETQSIKKADKKRKVDSNANGSPSKKIASREEIIEAAKAIAREETNREQCGTQTMKDMVKTKHGDSNVRGSQTEKREEIVEAVKTTTHDNAIAKHVGMNRQLLENGNEPTMLPTPTKDDNTRANDVAKEKKSNSTVSESRGKAKRRKKNETKRALEEAAVSPRINRNDDEGVDGNKASSGSPTTAAGKTATNAPSNTVVEKAKSRVLQDSVFNDSQSNLKSVKKQKIDADLSSTFSMTKIKSGKKAKVVAVSNQVASEASGQLGGNDKETAIKSNQKAKHLSAEKKKDTSISFAVSGVTDDKTDDLKNDATIVKTDSRKKTISTQKTAMTSGPNDTSVTLPKSPKAAGKMVSLLEHSSYSQSQASQKQATLETKKVPTDNSLEKKRRSKPSNLSERDAKVPAEPLEGFPEGWTKRRFPRIHVSGNKKKEDLFFYTPKMNIKLRSKTQAKDLLAKLAEAGGDEILAWGMMQIGAEDKDKKRKRSSAVENTSNETNTTKEDVSAHDIASTKSVTEASPIKKKAKSGKSQEKSHGSSKHKANNDPDKPKHPPNSFILYANSVRSKVAAENPSLTGHEVASD
ncbi:hypothetical protein ACHAW6_008664 [Cyclotella cf. meneghiniana]